MEEMKEEGSEGMRSGGADGGRGGWRAGGQMKDKRKKDVRDADFRG